MEKLSLHLDTKLQWMRKKKCATNVNILSSQFLNSTHMHDAGMCVAHTMYTAWQGSMEEWLSNILA